MATAMENRSLNPRSDPASPWWHIDVTPLLAAMGLGIVGLIAIYSATRGRDADNYITTFIERQGMFLVVGLVLVVLVVAIDYRWLLRFAPIIYLGTIGLLLLLRVFGVEGGLGVRSWFRFGSFLLQPSEFGKISLVVVFAALMSRRTEGPMPLSELSMLLAVGMLPIALVVLQPDIGTAMIYVAIVASMLLVGRAEAHHLIFLVAVSAVGFGLILNSPVLEEYQRDRLESFLDPDATARYNQNQAEIAIGNGGITGTGFGEGTQTKSGLVPEQQTDFIFTVIGEEFGFAGGTVLLGCYAALLWRLYRMARLAGDPFGAYLVTGVFAMFAFQMFQAVGMTMGIMPVTGIPLPFVSYGGSSALTSFLAIAIAINVHMRRFGAGIDAEVGSSSR
ncbi:MAG: FtsW/RodA/SpoVE family cell cycle protein [Actinomycetota bacterium]